MEERFLKEEKENLRKSMLQKRNKITANEEKAAANIINPLILSHPVFLEAEHVMVYIPFKKEVDIRRVIEEAWRLHKQVMVPKTDIKTKKMEPYVIRFWDDLKIGNFELFEPKGTESEAFPIDNIDLVLVPGIAFDHKGNRLGFGAGFYDRFFDRFTHLPFRLGIAYDFQVVDKLPTGRHDYGVNEVITEKRMISSKER